ncbi:variant erythrocyte surface antigen-1 family protein [Babesia divergens]|uniref:Variant erythrocyte surface antigen-1 family protein n=1 Tax=Babesia divergens TaxID=32595 RepID=A0AAD9GHM1_BABDI|nr:variant erythrocyte surface antigen-1 family protein [Babesia divergens]
MTQASTASDLLRCPKNLKECIDWVVILSGTTSSNTDSLKNLASAVEAELKAAGVTVFPGLTDWITTFGNKIVGFLGIDQNEFSGKGIVKSGTYKSSYSSNANWPDCFKTRTPCCSPSCGCPPCSPGGCCDACPKRLCAKIFLGFLPCLFHALKFLREKCNAGWKEMQIKKDTPLGSFLLGMGFGHTHLDESKDGQKISGHLYTLLTSGSLIPLYNASTRYFTSLSSTSPSDPKSTPKDPQTVRDMLLWLYGLRFTSGFKALLDHCKDLCAPFGNSFHPDAFCYYIYTCCFILPVAAISTIQDPNSHVSTFFSSAEWRSFSYPEDPFELFEKFCEYVRKIYIPLTFLRFQCKNDSGQGGWKYCYYGGTCAKKFKDSLPPPKSDSCSCSGSNAGQGYLCSYSKGGSNSNTDVHKQHCDQSKNCLGFGPSVSNTCNPSKHTGSTSKPGSACKPCPHPLQAFLCDSNPQSPSSPFKLPSSFARLDFSQSPPVILGASSEFLTMGFNGHLSSTAKSGTSIADVLKSFCDFGFFPLTRLCDFVLCVTLRPPSSLVELFAFFRRIGETLKSDTFNSNFVEWINGEPGDYSGESLKKALETLYGSEDSHWDKSKNSHKDLAPKSTPATLYSLYDCSGAKGPSTPGPTCGPYIYPLIGDAFQLHPKAFTGTYLSWVCYLAEKFKKRLEEFKRDFEKCPHCKGSSGSSKCESIVNCPCAHPFLYRNGFIFWRAWSLNCTDAYGRSMHVDGTPKHDKGQDGCTQKSCRNFLDQLKKVLESDAPLDLLIKAIDNFLWSIRLPFFFGFLYVWFFVISYFCYAILIKLDISHTGSHLHLPRSFKILPSTLFSDASSKLKDLSYFTL